MVLNSKSIIGRFRGRLGYGVKLSEYCRLV